MNEAEWRRARRAAVREHHPDAGGDADALQAALASIDRRRAAMAEAPRRVVVVAPPPRWRRVARALRAVAASRARSTRPHRTRSRRPLR